MNQRSHVRAYDNKNSSVTKSWSVCWGYGASLKHASIQASKPQPRRRLNIVLPMLPFCSHPGLRYGVRFVMDVRQPLPEGSAHQRVSKQAGWLSACRAKRGDAPTCDGDLPALAPDWCWSPRI